MGAIHQALLMYGAAGGGAFDPTTITGCTEWVSADQPSLSSFVNNDPVQIWTDRVTGTRTWSQATLANRPLFKTGGPNGKPYLSFDSTDVMGFSNTSSVLLANTGYTMFVVIRPQRNGGASLGSAPHLFVIGAGQGGMALKNDGSNRFGFWQRSGGSDGTFLGSTSTYTQNVWYVAEFWYDATNINIKVNNDTTTSTARGGTSFAGTPSIAILSLTSDMAERITYNVDIGSTNRDTVRNALATKYGLTML
jgi:hypothetical protein